MSSSSSVGSPFLWGALPLGPRLCLSALEGFRDAFYPEEGTTPEPIIFGRYSLTKLDCGMLWQPGYAVLGTRFSVKQFLVLLATLGGRSHLSSTSSVCAGSCGSTFLQEHESHRVHARRCTVLPRSFRIFATSDQLMMPAKGHPASGASFSMA